MADLQTITIRFKPKGDKQLINAIKHLDVVTKKLKGTTSVYEKEIKQVTRAQKKNNRATLLGVRNYRNMNKRVTKLAPAFSVLRSKLLLVSFATALVGGAFTKLFGKMIVQEKAEKKLKTALGKTSTALLHHASALQKVTTFGDEEIISAQALFAAYTDDEKAIKAATAATLDLSIAKGMDLTSAADLVSKSVFSSTNALSRYGITIKGAVGSTQRLNHATREISKLYGGQAKDQADTFGGKLEKLSNKSGDVAEQIGEFLSPALALITDELNEAASATFEFFKELNEFPAETIIRKFEELGIANENLVSLKIIARQQRLNHTLDEQRTKINAFAGEWEDVIRDVLPSVMQYGGGDWMTLDWGLIVPPEKFPEILEKASTEMFKLTEKLKDETKFQDESVKADFKRLEGLMQLVAMLETYQASIDKVVKEIAILQGVTEVVAKQNPLKEFFDNLDLKKINENVNNLKALTDAIKAVGDAYMNMQMQSLSQKKEADLAVAGNIRSERKRQKEIDKINEEAAKEEKKIRKNNQKFRIMDAIANTAVGVSKALELVFPLNMIVAGLVTAAGAMQVATLKAQKFERGGLVGGRRHSAGGTMIEAERGEFVMSRSAVNAVGAETMNRINAGGGAGNINISFAGNVMSDDFISEEAIPKIKEAIRRGADIGVS